MVGDVREGVTWLLGDLGRGLDWGGETNIVRRARTMLARVSCPEGASRLATQKMGR